MSIQIGDYVGAVYSGEEGYCKGIFVEDKHNGTIVVHGLLGPQPCVGPAGVGIQKLRDADMRPDMVAHAARVRASLRQPVAS